MAFTSTTRFGQMQERLLDDSKNAENVQPFKANSKNETIRQPGVPGQQRKALGLVSNRGQQLKKVGGGDPSNGGVGTSRWTSGSGAQTSVTTRGGSSKTLGQSSKEPQGTFTIYCDESFEEQEETLDLTTSPELSFHEAKENFNESLNTTTDTILELVGGKAERPALKELSLDSSILSARTVTEDDASEPNMDASMDRSRAFSFMESDDLKENDEDILLMSMEYQQDILQYLLMKEKEYAPDPDYMTRQTDVNFKMRSILIDWMVEVTDEYKLTDETLFLAVNYIDRFLSRNSIVRQSFQLLGSASLFISSKYEEIYPPDVNEFVYITDDSYSKTQVLNMEKLVLQTLDHNVSPPTTHYFMRKFLAFLPVSTHVSHLSEYLVYLTIMDSQSFLTFLPSEVALSAIILSIYTLGEEEILNSKDSYHKVILTTMDRLGPDVDLLTRISSCMEKLLEAQSSAGENPQQAVFGKYSHPKYFEVAKLPYLRQVPGWS